MAASSPIVQTSLGPVRGHSIKTDRGESILAFEGIPYAKPPIGELRFKPPVPIEPWTDVRDATQAGSAAACLVALPNMPPMLLPGSSEDCLSVNVFTPPDATKGSNLPVMVYIHGGGFNVGSGNRVWGGPDYLVPKGVILVSINYRLGAFGFLSLKTPEYSGNNGLKDQTLGLRWVQENISAFGGDPSNVTLCGISAGAASIQYHTLSPLSRGLFHRVVALSGSVLNRWAYSRHPVETATLLAKRLGAKPENLESVIDTLKNASTEQIALNCLDLFKEVEGEWASDKKLGTFPFAPTTEPEGTPNAFLTKHPKKALLDGDTADVPYVTGICKDEAIFVLPSADFVPDFSDEIELQKMLPKEVGIPLGSPKLKPAAEKLKNFYFKDTVDQRSYVKAQSMPVISYGVYKTVKVLANDPKKKTPNYLYLFNYERKNSICKLMFNLASVPGVCHGDDGVFIMKTSLPMIRLDPIEPGSVDDQVKEISTTWLTDFAKTGNLPSDWKAAEEGTNWAYMEITDKLTPKTGFLAEEGKLWDEIYEMLE